MHKLSRLNVEACQCLVLFVITLQPQYNQSNNYYFSGKI